MKLAAPSDPQMRPDGKQFAYVYRGEVYAGPADGAAERVAKGVRPRWSPDSKSLAFLEGQVQIQSRGPVTSAGSAITSFAWWPDSKGIAYLAKDPGADPDPVVNGEDPRFTRLYFQPLEGGSPKLLSKQKRNVISFAVAPDMTRVAYAAQETTRSRENFHIDIYEVDLANSVEKPLVVQAGRDADPSYSPDGKLIAFHSQCGSSNYFEAREVGVVPTGGGQIRYVTRGTSYDVFRNGNVFTWSADSQHLLYTAGQGIKDVLVDHDLKTGNSTVAAELISGAASFTPNLSRAVFLKTSPTRPAEIFLRENGKERQLTRLQEAVAEFPEVRSKVLRWRAKDGTEIEGVLWLPFSYKAGTPVPLLTELHGGPTGVTLDAFPIPRVYPLQVFLQSGIAVLSPNFRGSANYGAPFRLKNTLSQGVGDFDDVMSGVDKLIADGIADRDRLGVMGWSYGGYLTGSVVTQTNRFRAASIGAPAIDWTTYYGQTETAQEVLWTYFGGTPWDVPEKYARHSSRAGLKNIRTPSLLQVGALDINHNGEFFQALTDLKVPVEYTLYPREGHGFTEPAHIRDLMERNLSWFLRWLPKKSASK